MTKYIKILAYSLFLAVAVQPANGTEKIYKLWYTAPAANDGGVFEKDWSDRPTDADWERYSLPIGNGYMGASVFGRTDSERILLSDKTLHIRGLWGTETNTAFANVYLDFFHNNRKDYERSLTLNDGIQRVQYSYQGTTYKRTYFASYPDKIIAIKLTADQAASITFNVRIQIPYLVPFGALQRPDSITKGYLSGPTQTRFSGNGRTGRVVAESNDILSMRGETEYLKMIYEGRIKVIPYGGSIHANRTDDGNDWLHVEKADSAVILLTTGTNYKLQTSVFEGAPAGRLKNQADPHDEVVRTIEKASALGYEQLLERHSADYRQFFDRVKIDLGEALPALPTDKLLKNYKEGKNSNYLEELMFQYGRYLLICSSRKGTLPPIAARRVEPVRTGSVEQQLYPQHQHTDELLARFQYESSRALRKLCGLLQGLPPESGTDSLGIYPKAPSRCLLFQTRRQRMGHRSWCRAFLHRTARRTLRPGYRRNDCQTLCRLLLLYGR